MSTKNEDLLLAYKKEKDPRMIKRIHAICLIKIKGHTIAETAEIMFQNYQNVRNWLQRYDECGLEGLEDRLRSGRPPKITKKKMSKIKRTFLKIVDRMTPKKLMEFIYRRTGEKFHITHICRLMRSWELSAKVPQKRHAKAASVATCRKWRRNVLAAIKKAKKRGFSVFVQDESVLYNDARTGKKYWMQKSERMTVPYNGKHQKIFVYGMQSDAG